MRKRSARVVSFLLTLALMLSFLPAAVQTPVHAATQNQLNIVARANYLYNSTWVCQKTVEGWKGNYTFTKGETYRIPYGQPVYAGAYVGFSVSVDDYLAAAADASSVFYTKQSEYAGKTSTYYATDCSAFVSWSWGTSRNTTASIPNIATSKGAANSTNIKNLQLGDALNSTSAGHVVLVTGLTYDASGNLTQIEITEQTPPQLKRSYYTPSSLASKYSASYTIYRYSGTVPAAPSRGYVSECTHYPAHGSSKTITAATVMSLPCSTAVDSKSEVLGEVASGTAYTVQGLYENTEGDWWYAVNWSGDTTGYILASQIEYIQQDLSDITITGTSIPNGHVQGNSFVVRGTISAEYQKITSVAVNIYDGFGTSGETLTGESAAVSGNSYTLAGSTIDNATSFGSLGLGVHTYAISADYENYYIKDGALTKNTGRKYLVEEYFATISSSVEQSACSHTYENKTLVEGNCLTTGSVAHACTTCGYVYKETIAASGHNYGAWSLVTKGDCTTDEVQERACSNCGDVQTQTTAAAGHNYTVTTHPATCLEYERYEYICGTCGHNYMTYADELMSQWQETKPEGIDDSLIESKTQYRYSEYETTTSYEAALDGYTLVSKAWEQSGTGTVNFVKSWPAGFDTTHSVYTKYHNTPKTDSETESAKTTVNGESVVGYIYWHWCRGTYTGGPDNRKIDETKTGEFVAFHAFYSTTSPDSLEQNTAGWYIHSNGDCCTDTYRYYAMPVYKQSYTTERALFTYGKWADYTEWGDTVITASDTRKVETRTVYRYVNAELGGHSWMNGACTECGIPCNHNWVNSVCTTCGMACTHSWLNGVCNDCGKVCGHSWVSGTCGTCGQVCQHTYQNGTCTVCGEKEPVVLPTLTLVLPSLVLEEEVKYNIYFTAANLGDLTVSDMGLALFKTMPDDGGVENADSVIPGAIKNSGYYMVQSGGIPAKEMGDDLYFRVYVRLEDGSYVYSKVSSFNAVKYAQSVLNSASHPDGLKKTCVALMNYGASAQTYFGYKTDSLMNSFLTADQQAMVNGYDASMVSAIAKAESAKVGEFAAVSGAFTKRVPSVSLEGAFTINYYFKPAKTVDGDMTFYYWDKDTYNSVDVLTKENALGSKVMSPNSANEYWASFDGIAAKELDDTVYVAAVYESDGATYSTGVLAVSISVLCQTHMGSNANLTALTESMVVYGDYAKSYFGN